MALAVSVKMNKTIRCLDLNIPVGCPILNQRFANNAHTCSPTIQTLPDSLKTSFNPAYAILRWRRRNPQRGALNNLFLHPFTNQQSLVILKSSSLKKKRERPKRETRFPACSARQVKAAAF